MGFPNAFFFIDQAFMEMNDYFKDSNKSNPLIDDVF